MYLQKISYMRVPNVTQETQFMYKKLDEILERASKGEEPLELTQDEKFLFVDFSKHIMDSTLSDHVLYSRLYARCVVNAEILEQNNPDVEFSMLGVEYLSYSHEMTKTFGAFLTLAQELGYGCGLDFELKNTANLKFASSYEFIDFTVRRMMISIGELYAFYRLLLDTDILDDIEEDYIQVDMVMLIKEALVKRQELFDELSASWDKETPTEFIDILTHITEDLDDGF